MLKEMNVVIPDEVYEKSKASNQVWLVGRVASNYQFSHRSCGENFYLVELLVLRLSENFDILKIMISERLLQGTHITLGDWVCVQGQFRSKNMGEPGNRHLFLSVFARSFEKIPQKDNLEDIRTTNMVLLDGYICKEPEYRKTGLGKDITDMLLAVNRIYGRSDYIPCISWGSNARFVKSLPVGTHLILTGRIQSREYQKDMGNHVMVKRTAYEVSISNISVDNEL